MNDHEAIARLLFTYAERVDAGDFAGVGDLFADGEITNEGYDGAIRGQAAVQALFEATTRRYPETGTPRTKHVVTNVMVDVSGEHATAASYFTVLQQTPTLPLQPVIAGRYRDEFVGGPAGWRFAHRHIICDLFGDLSQHLLIDVRSPDLTTPAGA